MAESSKRSDALKRAQAKYRASKTRQKSLQFYLSTDADILAYIEKINNFSGYIKSLIRADMAAKGIVPDTSTVAPKLPDVRPGLRYSDPDGTWEILRINGNDVMIQDVGEGSPTFGKKYATTLEEVEKYIQ